MCRLRPVAGFRSVIAAASLKPFKIDHRINQAAGFPQRYRCGLIEAAKKSRDLNVIDRSFRSVIAAASLKLLGAPAFGLLLLCFRSVIAAASLKPMAVGSTSDELFSFRSVIAAASLKPRLVFR